MAFSRTLLRNANRGGALMSQYPLGNAPLLLADQDPWELNTPALSASGSGTAYTITSQAEAVAFDWGALVAGDAVNIYPLPNDEPYRITTRVWGQGTATDRIIINGVVQNGKAPIFSGENAVATQHTIDEHNGGYTSYVTFLEGRGIFHLWKGPVAGPGSYPDNEQPRYITIQNIDFRDADQSNTYTSADGTVKSYNQAATSLWHSSTGSKHITFQYNSSTGMGNGLFFNSNGEVTVSEDWLIKRNRFTNNGAVGSDREHCVYCAGHRVTYEGNFFGPNKNGALGGGVKDRSSAMVFRYNTVYGNARLLDFVDSDHYAYLDANNLFAEYDDSHCYGNVLINDSSQNSFSARLVHWGGDNAAPGPGRSNYRIGTLFFYNNTVINMVPASTRDRIGIFQIDTDGFSPTQIGSVDAQNNVIVNIDDTNLIWNDSAVGTVNLEGANVIDVNGAILYQDAEDRVSGNPNTTLNQNGTLIEQTVTLVDPSNADIFARDPDIDPSDTSGALTAGVALPAGLSSYPLDQQYERHYKIAARSTITKLGAVE